MPLVNGLKLKFIEMVISTQNFKNGGIPATGLVKLEKQKTGTKVTFKPDSEIFKSTTTFNFDILSERLQESAFYLKI